MSFFDKGIDLRIDCRVDKLKYFFIFLQLFLHFVRVCLIFFYVFPCNFYYVWMNHIPTVQIHKIIRLANVFTKTGLVTLFLKHLNYFSGFKVIYFSLQREGIDVFVVNVYTSKTEFLSNKFSSFTPL